MRWTWGRRRPSEPVNQVVATTDAVFAQFFTPGGFRNITSVRVDERGALSQSAMYRAVSLVAGQLASLPFRSFIGTVPPRPVASILDDPDPDGQTVFEWKETAFAHLMLYGRCGALKLRNEGGGLVALPLVHPRLFKVRQPEKRDTRQPAGGVWFDVTIGDVQQTFDAADFWHVPGALSFAGQEACGLIDYARLTLATARSGDEAVGNMLTNGALISGLATPDEDQDITDDVPEIRRQLNAATTGAENAGAIAVINRKLKLQPWTMTNADAQLLQQRQFSIEEISRFTGVPPHLLMQTEKQTSWGTGVEMQDRALGRSVLNTWATRFEQRASRLLANPRHAEFDFSALERPSPDREIELDLQQVAAGVMTVDEYRIKRGWTPLDPAPAPAPPEGGSVDPTAQ